MQNMSFSRSKKNQNVIFFGCKHFFKISQVKKFLIQNLTRCINLNPKPEAL